MHILRLPEVLVSNAPSFTLLQREHMFLTLTKGNSMVTHRSRNPLHPRPLRSALETAAAARMG